MSIDHETLKNERAHLKEQLRELEADQRKLEGQLKNLRQQELKTKREIEALSTLVELGEARQEKEKEQEPESPK